MSGLPSRPGAGSPAAPGHRSPTVQPGAGSPTVRPGARSPAERPAVMIMARAPRRGEIRQALEPMIGADGCLALHAALFLEALAWARSISPRGIFVAHEPAHAGRELHQLAGPEVSVFPQNGEGIAGRVADALVRVTAHSSGPVFVVWPDLPRFPATLAEAVLGDLDAGVDLVLGPAFESGYYLVAMARPLPSLFTRGEQLWRGRASLVGLLGASATLGLSVGLLNGQRALHRPADARAALADPLLPETIARALRRRP